jgi:hypothetical protein
LTFAGAECIGMTGTGGSTKAVFTSVAGVTSGTVTLDVSLKDSATADQTVTVTAVTGANTAGTSAVGTPQTYTIPVNATSSLTILTQPVDTTVLSGTKATFSVEAAGAEPLAYQWYVNTNSGVGWLALSGATEATYTTEATTLASNGFRYYCRVTNASRATVDSESVTLTVVTSPQTGDNSNIGWMLALLALTIAGIIFAPFQRNTAKKQR